jgi:hypothetical protein
MGAGEKDETAEGKRAKKSESRGWLTPATLLLLHAGREQDLCATQRISEGLAAPGAGADSSAHARCFPAMCGACLGPAQC